MRSSLLPGGEAAAGYASRWGRRTLLAGEAATRAQAATRARAPMVGRGALHAATRGCLAGTGVCFVSHTGKVYGCGYMPIEAGDLRQMSLAEIWQTSEFFGELRNLGLLEGKCGRLRLQHGVWRLPGQGVWKLRRFPR